jgi:flap endonuclease GEN
MTVSSLWKVLDRANCGKLVGAQELTCSSAEGAAGHRRGDSRRLALAVDLSIWICEGLASVALSEHHKNPALLLVFSRTIKLLSMGIKLVGVVEGKRRVRVAGSAENGNNQAQELDKFRQRRSGTAFWKACNDCQQLLRLLGVPVVRAKAEGEALCALLNQRGIVDGVISNDGDCLLFGAKTVYTKFTIENLANSRVVRYDMKDLRAVIEASDDLDLSQDEIGTMSLSRHDLIAFALLTGSDLAGIGLQKVGHKKAIRFIRKCHLDYPRSKEMAAMEELRSWARTAAVAHPIDESGSESPTKTTRCSRCSHRGSKGCHKKHGCEICGTGPGEPCHQLTSDDKFRKSLRAKALQVQPPFDPSFVFSAYMAPNDNQLPLQLAKATAESLRMAHPSLQDILGWQVIVKGQSLDASREHVKQSVVRLMSRNELLYYKASDRPSESSDPRQALSRECPIPQKITKLIVQNSIPCYQVSWVVKATLTDDSGNGIDGYEYSTIEPRHLFDDRYPHLADAFQVVEMERQKQGDAEQQRRAKFLEEVFGLDAVEGSEQCDRMETESPRRNKKLVKKMKKRRDVFERKAREGVAGENRNGKSRRGRGCGGDDVACLLHATGIARSPITKQGKSSPSGMEIYVETKPPIEGRTAVGTPSQGVSTEPGQGVYCRMGGYMIQITPLKASLPVGISPPRFALCRRDS